MISVILIVYKRPHTLEKQLEAIRGQTVEILEENIHILNNNANEAVITEINSENKLYDLNYNSGIFSRFAIALLCRTKYVAILDDDVMPGKKWFENCLQTSAKLNNSALLGGSGVILGHKGYQKFVKVGWNGIHMDQPVHVDLVGHSWFFLQEHAKHMFNENPPNWNNGEDIWFSFQLQKQNILIFVPPHPEAIDPESAKNVFKDDYPQDLWSNIAGTEYAADENAMYNQNWEKHKAERDQVVKIACYNGWRLIHEIWNKFQ